MTGLVRYEVKEGVATATLNAPERLNPMSQPLQDELTAALERAGRDPAVRVLVLTGAGRAFCVGADLEEMHGKLQGEASAGAWTAQTMRERTNPLIARITSLRVPVLAAVNGPAAGVGVGVALAADITLAAASAYFYLPFLPRLGIVPDGGSTWFLPRLVGRARSMGLSLLGDRLGAGEAAAWGLIWRAVPDEQLAAETAQLAARLAALPAHAVEEARRAFAAAEGNTLHAQLDYEAQRQGELIDRPEFAEGVAAFREKRTPGFR